MAAGTRSPRRHPDDRAGTPTTAQVRRHLCGRQLGRWCALTLPSAAHSQLSISAAGNYDPATCKPSAIDGVRVYPPNQTAALFVETTAYQGCANATVKLLQVRPLQSGAA